VHPALHEETAPFMPNPKLDGVTVKVVAMLTHLVQKNTKESIPAWQKDVKQQNDCHILHER